jgi:hypothetical protein
MIKKLYNKQSKNIPNVVVNLKLYPESMKDNQIKAF